MPIAVIAIEEIEEFCADWYRKLTYVQRNETLRRLKGPMSFVEYILKQIEHIKEFFPLLQALKAKGLERRHIVQINRELGTEISIKQTNFRWLSKRDLHKGKKLEKIKQITDTATKEHAIRLTLESVEAELENTNLRVEAYRDTGTSILRGLEDDLAQFQECDLKVSSIAHNQFAKVFKDRLDRIGRDLRFLIEFYSVWKDLQKYWAYLLPIFEQKDIAVQMKQSYDIFMKIDKIYRAEIDHAGKDCKTYRTFAKREGLNANLHYMVKMFEFLMKCLIKYLEAKREYFPRLYFLSNEQIIEVVGMMEDARTLE